MLEGVSVNVVDSQSRECCLKGYAFLLEPENKVIVSLFLLVFQFLSIAYLDFCCDVIMCYKV